VNPTEFLNSINAENFEQAALATFVRQYATLPIYKQYVDILGRQNPKRLAEIPCVPIEFFKLHQVVCQDLPIVKTFQSSGTTQQIRSKHYITDLSWYDASLLLGFERVFGSPKEYVFIALLPSYLENGDSSLIYMVDKLIQKSNNSLSGYYLSQMDEVLSVYNQALAQGRKPFVFGVSHALLDLAQSAVQLPEALVLETGGMKGKRPELTKKELHNQLCGAFGLQHILSEYGMTELLSQAYSSSEQTFACPPWMQIRIRDAYDPFTEVPFGQKGGINVLDLANQNSCAFIQTDDLGRLCLDGFSLEGRLMASDVRGCNQLVD